MKTRFAKFIDGTLGFVLMYAAAFSVLCYFIPKSFAALTALSFCSALYLIFGFKERINGSKTRLSKNASEMFFNFMFEGNNAPAKLLKTGLNNKGISSALHGNALYTGKTSAFFHFASPPTQTDVARDVAKAKRYGCKKLLVFSESSKPFPQIDGYEIVSVTGDDVYRLFRSLDCLPERKFNKKSKRRFSALLSALSKDKLPRYFLLAAGLGAVAFFTRSVVCIVCAAVAVILFVASVVFCAVKAKKRSAT